MINLSSTNDNAALPTEILSKVSSYIPFSDKTKKVVREVYRSWYNAALQQFGKNTQFCINEDSVCDSGDDLQAYPNLRAKIISLTVNPYKIHECDGFSSSLFARVALPLCPNLEEFVENILRL
jgi:hypothetical protein